MEHGVLIGQKACRLFVTAREAIDSTRADTSGRSPSAATVSLNTPLFTFVIKHLDANHSRQPSSKAARKLDYSADESTHVDP